MHRSVPIALGVLTLIALAPSSANAATFQCNASALRLTVATTPAQEPITANRGGAACAPQEAGGTLPASPVPITGGAVYARTNLAGAEPLSQVATASAGTGELSVPVPRAVDPSRIDIAKVPVPAGVDLSTLQATLQPVLDTLPDAEVPAATLHVRTTPGEQTVSGDRLTRKEKSLALKSSSSGG